MTKRHLTVTIIFALALAISGCRSGANVKDDILLKASVDRKSIRIGDRIKLTVKAKVGRGDELALPKFDDYRIGDFEIKDSGVIARNRLLGGKVLKYWYSVSAYTVGKSTIPQIDVKFRKKGRKDWTTKKTPAIDVNVTSVLPSGKQPSDIRGIKGPLSYRNVYWGILALGSSLLLFIAAFAVFYRSIKRYGPVKLPHETALEELENVRAKYLQGGEVKEYYVGVSDCIRRYIERAFSLKAPEMTTEEFLNSLRESSALSIEQKDLLKGFLGACDLVKFAKYAPTTREAEGLYETAGVFIRQTVTPAGTTTAGTGGAA